MYLRIREKFNSVLQKIQNTSVLTDQCFKGHFKYEHFILLDVERSFFVYKHICSPPRTCGIDCGNMRYAASV